MSTTVEVKVYDSLNTAEDLEKKIEEDFNDQLKNGNGLAHVFSFDNKLVIVYAERLDNPKFIALPGRSPIDLGGH